MLQKNTSAIKFGKIIKNPISAISMVQSINIIIGELLHFDFLRDYHA